MSHYIDTIVKSSNPDFAEACVAAFEKKGFSTCVNSKDGVTKISLYLNWYFPKKEINAVSKRFPDDIVIVGYSDELHDYSPCFEEEHTGGCFYTWEVQNGKAISEDLEPDYYFRMPSKIEEDWSLICHKVVSFCRTLDKIEYDKDGKWFQWFDDDVVYEFEYESINGRRYRAEITKSRWVIDFNKVFEQVSDNDWQKITIPAIRYCRDLYEKVSSNDDWEEITGLGIDDSQDYVHDWYNRFYE